MLVSAQARDRLSSLWTPRARFVLGGVALVLFVLQQHPWLKLGEVLLFGLLAVSAGKRIRWAYFAILICAITVFNLLSPWGEVLIQMGPFVVTRGALQVGVFKGLTITGMVFVSLFAVSRDLMIPGPFGRLLGRTFYYFERLSSEKKNIRRNHVVEDIDSILERMVLEAEATTPRSTGAEPWSRRGLALGILLLGTMGGALFLSYGIL
jgi:heptaprenyl diphosphate synthase